MAQVTPTPTPLLGELLLKHTSLSQAQLTEALDLQAKEGIALGEILIRKSMVTPHEIMRALCMQIGIPFIEELKANEIDPVLISQIPINYAKSKEVIPILLEQTDHGETLSVVVADPFNPSI